MFAPNPILQSKAAILLLKDMPPRESGTKPKRRSKPNQRQYAKAVLTIARKLDVLAAELAQSGNVGAYVQSALDLLEEGHAIAASLGRQRAGDPAPFGSLDSLRAAITMREESKHFDKFRDQLESRDARYIDFDGGFDPQKVAGRSRNYLGKMRGTANDAFVGSSSDDDLFDWVMLAEEHCSRCPVLEAGSPYTKATLPTYPGAGDTPCKSNCACVLVRYDGTVGFARFTDPKPEVVPGQVPVSDDFGDIPVIDVTGPDDPRLQDWFVT